MKKAYGFTIVELLVVIVVIAILAAVSVVAYSGVAAQARDSQRAQDLANIKRMLLLYNTEYSGVARTTTYNLNASTRSGWDASVDEDWLAFLGQKYGRVPVDPINRMGSGSLNPNSYSYGHHSYFYHCYRTPSPNVVIGYQKDGGSQPEDRVTVRFDVSACL